MCWGCGWIDEQLTLALGSCASTMGLSWATLSHSPSPAAPPPAALAILLLRLTDPHSSRCAREEAAAAGAGLVGGSELLRWHLAMELIGLEPQLYIERGSSIFTFLLLQNNTRAWVSHGVRWTCLVSNLFVLFCFVLFVFVICWKSRRRRRCDRPTALRPSCPATTGAPGPAPGTMAWRGARSLVGVKTGRGVGYRKRVPDTDTDSGPFFGYGYEYFLDSGRIRVIPG
jgi:hypothetical protein